MPTLADTIPGFSVDTFVGVVVPARTPPAAVLKLNALINQAILSPEVDGKLKEIMFVPMTASVDQFRAFVDQQTAKWGTLIKSQKLNEE